jgi:hypothetical protein
MTRDDLDAAAVALARFLRREAEFWGRVAARRDLDGTGGNVARANAAAALAAAGFLLSADLSATTPPKEGD